MAAHNPLPAGEQQLASSLHRPTGALHLLHRLFLVVAVLLFWQGEAWATHAMGGELTYRALTNNRYEVTLNFYRDCNGIAAPTNCNNGLEFRVRSANCGANFTQCFPNNPTVTVITPLCANEQDRCNSTAGTWGVEKYTYTRIVDLGSYSSCTNGNWTFSWSLCCRNNAITSLNNPGNRELYLDAELHDAPGLHNSAPTFTNSPAPFYCIGEPISYNPGAVDNIDGDSLAYRLIAARGANGSNIPYNNNYSALQPIRNTGGANAVVLNPVTGTMTVTPSVIQVAVVTYEVREYRNGVHIGTVTRDVQFVVRPCSGNNPPTATGINGTSDYSMEVCAGTPVSFTVNSFDQNPGQNVTMAWNGGIPSANFTVSGSPHPTGTFTWTPTVANLGNNTFTVVVTDDGCPLVATNDYGFTIVVKPPATDADAGDDFAVCGSTATMNAVLPYPGLTGTWSVVSGSGTFTNPNSRTSQVTGLAAGENVFRWTVDYSPCGQREATVTVTSYNTAQAAAQAGPDQSICVPPNSVALAANPAVAPAQGTWSFVNGTGTITDEHSPTTTVTGVVPGVTRLRWTINNGPCGSTQDEVEISIFNGDQAVANAGSDISICSPQNTVTLNGNAVTAPAQGTWTLVSGAGGTITNPNQRNTTVTGLPVGVHVFRWTIANGPCTPSETSDDVTVTVYSGNSPAADAGADQDICLPGTVTMDASQPIAPSTGSWAVISGSGTFSSNTDPQATVSDLGIGVNVFQWTVNNGPCASGATSDQVTITAFDPTINSADAGPDRSFCLPTTSVTMQANPVTAPAQGTWTLVSGSGTITNDHSAITTVTGLAVGENIFRWEVANGPCPVNPPSDEVSIFIYDDQAPAAAAGPDQELCTPINSASLAGNAPTFPQTGTWSVVQGQGTFINEHDPNTTVVNLGVGQNRLRWTLDNGPCSNPITEDDVVITVYSSGNAVANAGPDQDLCTPVSSTTMAGSPITAPAVGTWSLVSGTGTIVSPNNPNTQITGLTVGEHVFRWSVANGPCANGNTQDDVVIRVFNSNNPDANAGPDQELCSDAGPVTLAGSAVTGPATGTWTFVSGTGSITDPSSPNTTVTGLGVGVYTLRWTVNNSSCGSGTTDDEMTITIYDADHPAVTAGPDQSICIPTGANEVTVNGSGPVAPATGVWTVVSGSGTITSPTSATTTITNMAVGVNVFRWSVINGPCTFSGNTALVTITVYDGTVDVADAGADQNLCTNTTTLDGSLVNAPGIGVWSVVTGNGDFVDPNDPHTDVNNLALGTNVFRWTVDNGPCAAPTQSTVNITVNDGDAQQANAGTDQEWCGVTSTTLGATPVDAPAIGQWTIVSGPGTPGLSNASNPTATLNGLQPGVTILTWSVDNGACGTSNDQLRITVYDPNTPAANAGDDQQLCTPNNSTTMDATAVAAPAQGTWTSVGGSGDIVSPNNPHTAINNLPVGVHVFIWTVDNGECGTTQDEVVISVFSGNAQAANAGPDQDLCSDDATTALEANNATGPAQGTWTGPSGVVFGDLHDPQTTVSGLQIGDNVLTWTIDNGDCGSTSDQVNIRVFNKDQADAFAGPDQDLCNVFDTNMAADQVDYPATGTWILVSGHGTIVDNHSPNTAITDLEVGPNVFRWTVDNGPCGPATTSEVTIVVYDSSVSGANAGPDRDICTPQDVVIMNASPAPSPAEGTWTLVSGDGSVVITDQHSPTTTITGLAVGQYTFRWTVTNGPCEVDPPSDELVIRVFDEDQEPADAGDNQDLCIPVGQATASTTLQGNPVTFPAQGTWVLTSGDGTIADIHDPNSDVTDLTVGVHVFEWSVDNGPCTDAQTSDRVTIFVFDPNSPAANAGPDQQLCTPASSTTLQGNTPPAPAMGHWELLQGAGNITDPTSPTSTVTGLAVGENIFIWTVENGPCDGSTTVDAVSIFLFDSSMPNADAGADDELCWPTNTYLLQGSAVVAPAIGTWSVLSGSAQVADFTSPSAQATNLSIGANTFRWTVSNGDCSSSSADVTIYVYDNNNPDADAGEDQRICSPESVVTMHGSDVTYPAEGTWTIVSGSGIISNPHSPTTNVIDLEVGTTVLAWTVYNGPCANGTTSDMVTIEVFDADNPIADAGPDQDLCTSNGTSVQLDGSLVIAPAVGTWNVEQGSGSFGDLHDPQTVVTGLAVGVNVFSWTVYNGNCATGTTVDEVTIRLYDENNPVADAGADQELCSDNPATVMNASIPTFPATGQWVLVSGYGVIADISSPTTDITELEIGENVFQWTVENGPCGTPTSDQMSIFVFDESNPDADAGPDQQICTPVTGTTMAGSPITFPATGTWELISGGGTIVDASDPQTAIVDLVPGVNIFRWTVNNGPCGAGVTWDEVTIELFDLNAPPADAGPDESYCYVDGLTHEMVANTPTSPAIGVWSVTQGVGIFADENDPATTVSGLEVGENIFTWSFDNGICGFTADNVSIFVFDPMNPSAYAGPSQEWCTPQDSTWLEGNTPIFPAHGEWTLVDGAGVFEDPTDPGTKVVGMAIGDNIFRWTTYNGPCENGMSISDVIVTIYSDSTAAANAGDDFELCLPFTSAELQADTPQLPATGTWSILDGAGTLVDPSDPHSEITGLEVGVTVLLWELDNGPCPNNGLMTDTLRITVYDPFDETAIANAGPDIELCGDDHTTMAAGAPDFPAEGTWALVDGVATIADEHDPLTAVTELGIGINVFTWTVYNGDCGFGPPTVDTVRVYRFDENAPAAEVGIDLDEICGQETPYALQANDATFPGTGTWSSTTTGVVFADEHDPNTTVDNLAIGDNVLVWTIDNGPCGTTTDTTVIRLFDPDLPAPFAGNDEELCLPTTFTNLNAEEPPYPATGHWSVAGGQGLFADANDPHTQVNSLGLGVNTLVWTLENGPCGTLTDTVRIILYNNELPAANAGPDQELCGVQSTTLAATAVDGPAAGHWTIVSGTGSLSNEQDPHAVLTDLSPGEVILTWTIDNGPCDSEGMEDSVTITIYDGTLAPANAGDDRQFCEEGPINVELFAQPVDFPAVGAWSIAGEGDIADPSNPHTTVNGVGFGTTVMTWTVDNGACGTSSSELVIQVFDVNANTADAGLDQFLCHDTTLTWMDALPANSTASGHWSLIDGHGVIVHPDEHDTEVNGLELGDNIFVWTVDNGACGTTVDTMVINLRDCSILVVPDAFSPNGDGVNDIYVVQGLEYYPNNSFVVFNRWGNKVYERSPYTNTWDGISESKAAWGTALPESTYYFILDPGNGDDVITGYIYLRR